MFFLWILKLIVFKEDNGLVSFASLFTYRIVSLETSHIPYLLKCNLLLITVVFSSKCHYFQKLSSFSNCHSFHCHCFQIVIFFQIVIVFKKYSGFLQIHPSWYVFVFLSRHHNNERPSDHLKKRHSKIFNVYIRTSLSCKFFRAIFLCIFFFLPVFVVLFVVVWHILSNERCNRSLLGFKRISQWFYLMHNFSNQFDINFFKKKTNSY